MNCGFILVLLHIYYIQAMHEINDPNGFSSLESLHTFRTQDNSPGVFSRIYTKFTDLFKTTKRELGYENEDANVVHYNKDADDEWSQLICDAERNTNETNPATGDPSKKKNSRMCLLEVELFIGSMPKNKLDSILAERSVGC